MKYKITFIAVMLSFTTFGQSLFTAPIVVDTCGTADLTETELAALPWYGDENETFLNNFYDSLENAMGNAAARGVVSNVWFRIPVHFWIYQVNGTTPGGNTLLPNEEDLQRLMDDANEAFRNNGIKMQFYLNCYEFINNSNGINVTNGTTEYTIANANRKAGAINVHVVDQLSGAAGKYSSLYNAIFIRRETYTSDTDATTFTHEIGHYFGLLHTHHGNGILCLREPVTRGWKLTACPNGAPYSKRCAWTGDLLCSTPADPKMSYNDINNCVYVGTKKDYYNDTYQPDVTNYMAYGNHDCRSTFSSGQIKVMYWWLVNIQVGMSVGLNWSLITDNTSFDVYEPDNTAVAAREITLGEVQEHSFYGAASGICEDDTDWVRFTYPQTNSSGFLRFEIRDLAGTTTVDEANVYERDVTGIVSGPALTGLPVTTVSGTQYIGLPCASFVPGQQYLLELRRGSSTNARYEVAFVDIVASTVTLTGPSLVCASEAQFTLNNVPAGATVEWQVGPPNLFTNATGSGVTANLQGINPTGAGSDCLIQFTITAGCGSKVIQQGFDVAIPPVPDIVGSPGNPSIVQPNTTLQFVVADYAPMFWDFEGNSANYTYTISPSDWQCNFIPTAAGNYKVKVRANYGCGFSGYDIVDVICSRPDLTIQSLSVSQPGSAITLSYNLKNIGLLPAPSPVVNYYRSSNSTYDIGDTYLGTSSFSTLAANGTVSSGNVTLTLSGSGSYILAYADPSNVMSELLETNNVQARILMEMQMMSTGSSTVYPVPFENELNVDLITTESNNKLSKEKETIRKIYLVDFKTSAVVYQTTTSDKDHIIIDTKQISPGQYILIVKGSVTESLLVIKK